MLIVKLAALRSGIAKGAINAAWDAIGEVIKAWATEGHSVAVPGLGTMRLASPSLLTLDNAQASLALCSLLHRFKDGVSSAVTSRTYSKVEAGGGGDDEPGGDDH